MKVLPINESYSDDLNWFKVNSIMLFPGDRHLRKEYETALLCESALREKVWNKNDFSSMGGIRTCIKVLLHAPSYDQIMDLSFSESLKASAAAKMLLFMVQLDQIGKRPSIKKAIFFLQESYKKNGEKINQFKIGKSDVSIRDNWKHFKPVCHLWAAYIAFYLSNKTENEVRMECPKPLADFLAEAEFFRRFGEKTISEKVNRPVFSENELWRVPEGYSIPECNPSFEQTDDWTSKTIKEYSVY